MQIREVFRILKRKERYIGLLAKITSQKDFRNSDYMRGKIESVHKLFYLFMFHLTFIVFFPLPFSPLVPQHP